MQFPLWILIGVVFLYCLLLYGLSRVISAGADNSSFFNANRKAPWGLVAYGMVGASISGVTFISVPGNVISQNFYYLPMVAGFVLGYFFVAKVLLPQYSKLENVSIYSFLSERCGVSSRKCAAFFFFLSRLLSCAVRVFVVAVVLLSFYKGENPALFFVAIVLLYLLLLFLYTFKGGVKTLVWTDVFHTTVMLLAVGIALYALIVNMDIGGLGGAFSEVFSSEYSNVFDFRWESSTNFVKQIVAGFFMTVAMTGLDQGMMQKTLGCKDFSSSKKNLYATAGIIFVVNLLFLFFGALLALFVNKVGGLESLSLGSTDEVFPWIASNVMGGVGVVIFLLGLISSSYPSSAATVTSLTSSVYHDFLELDLKKGISENVLFRKRFFVELAVVFVLFLLIIALYFFSDDSVLDLIYSLASYTYGPLLGLFAFALWVKKGVQDRFVPFICLASPILSYLIHKGLIVVCGFDLGFSLLIINGVITFAGLMLFKKR